MRLEQLAPAPQHADAGRPEHLVPGEHQEIGAERESRPPAGAAPTARRRPAPARPTACAAAAISATGGDRAGDVGLVRDRDQLRAAVDELVSVAEDRAGRRA